MEESFSILCLPMMLFFVSVDVHWSHYSPFTLDWKLLLFFPLLGASGRVMKTLAAGMCGKFQICSGRENWQIIFFDGYRKRKALRETDS